MRSTIMRAYAYNAGLICEDCAKDWAKTVIGCSLAGLTADDMGPDGPIPDGGGENDSPNHCDNGEDCISAMVLPDGRKVGCFLENPLTSDGVAFVEDLCRHELIKGEDNGVALNLWAPYYKIELAPMIGDE